MKEFEVLKEIYLENADAEYAKGMSAYMRNHFQFLGLRSPIRREIQSPVFKAMKNFDFNQISQMVSLLWNEPYREYQYAACELLRLHTKKIPLIYIDEIERLIITKSWWDSVDSIVPSICGDYFKKYPDAILTYIPKWVQSDNIWLQRAAILFQLKYKKSTDYVLLFSIIDSLKDSKEFFVNKAIGWALRELSKTNPTLVFEFVSNNSLSNLSKREALKIITKTY